MSDQQPPSNPYGRPGEPQPYGQPQHPQGQPQPYGAPGGAYGLGAPGADPDKRPGTVVAASVITIVFSGLVLLATVFGAIGLAVAGEQAEQDIQDELANQPGLEGVSTSDILAVSLAVVIVMAVWSLIAIITAFLAMARHNWARIVTVVSAAVTALLSLLGIASLVSGLTLIAAVAAIVLYFVGGANEWYARKGGPPQHPGAPQPPQPWG